MGNKHLTLYELNSLVRDTIEVVLPQEYWVEAELSEAKEWGGHCYMELIEKDEYSNTPVAKASAKCWKNTWMLVKPHFERVTGQSLRAGLKVLLKVRAQFHENYGFSWIVTDIDPAYTMGDMARKRQEIIRQLKEEGVFDLQKELQLPLFAQRIAVISSNHAAGYGDFCSQLEHNEYGFKFSVTLFPAIMQGEGVEQSIIAALEQIYQLSAADNLFDAVVIIRGGGATSDLSGFDTLMLAENVANFPLPIITGIGHERDESVLDMISHTRVKTPTAAAAFLIDHLKQVHLRIADAQEMLLTTVSHRMQLEKIRLDRLASQIPVLFSVVKTHQTARLDTLFVRLTSRMRQRIEHQSMLLDARQVTLGSLTGRKMLMEKHRLELLSQRMEAVNPERLLSRGYSITTLNGRVVRDAAALKEGDVLVTRLEKGTVKSKVYEKGTEL
jgi:exodeoxyribonuclease VII large subunit